MRTWDQRLHDEGLVREGPHAGVGMHRQCELNLLTEIVNGFKMAGFLVLGCGRGAEFLDIQDQTQCVGVDHIPGVVLQNATYWHRNIIQETMFDQVLLRDIGAWANTVAGPTLFYCDNGFKVAELVAMASLCQPGDILGTHDFGTEVPLDFNEFLEEQGFIYMNRFDEYIDKFLCMQGFWLKVGDYVIA